MWGASCTSVVIARRCNASGHEIEAECIVEDEIGALELMEKAIDAIEDEAAVWRRLLASNHGLAHAVTLARDIEGKSCRHGRSDA